MTTLVWDQIEERVYQTGVDRGVLYLADASVVWNGFTGVEDSSGSELREYYLEGIKYLQYLSPGDFSGKLKAFSYPDEFNPCMGIITDVYGLERYDQPMKSFGLAYRTKIGNVIEGLDFAYKIHLLYNLLANTDTYEYLTISEKTDPIEFAWGLSARPPIPNISGGRPSSQLSIDSTKMLPENLSLLEDILYGTDAEAPRLPLPDEIVALLSETFTVVRLTGANAPTYNSGTHVVTLPTVVGVNWWINGLAAVPGAQPAMIVDESSYITVTHDSGYILTGGNNWVFDY